MTFRIIQSSYTSDLEEKLNRLENIWDVVEVQALDYNKDTKFYTVVVKVGDKDEKRPYLSQYGDYHIVGDKILKQPEIIPVKTDDPDINWIQEKCGTNNPPKDAPNGYKLPKTDK